MPKDKISEFSSKKKPSETTATDGGISKKKLFFLGLSALGTYIASNMGSRSEAIPIARRLDSITTGNLTDNSSILVPQASFLPSERASAVIPQDASYTQEFFKLPTSKQNAIRVKTAKGMKAVPQSAPILLPDSIGVVVDGASIFTARLSNPDNPNEWVQVNYIEPPIKARPGEMDYGVYFSSSVGGIIPAADYAGFLHHTKMLHTTQPGGLALRIGRIKAGQPAVQYDSFYPKASQAGLQVEEPLPGIGYQWTYKAAHFTPGSGSYNFNAGYDQSKPVTDPSQTEWVARSTLDRGYDSKFMARLTVLTLGTDGKLSITRQNSAASRSLGIGYVTPINHEVTQPPTTHGKKKKKKTGR